MGENNLKDFLLQLPIYLQIEQDINKSEYIKLFSPTCETCLAIECKIAFHLET